MMVKTTYQEESTTYAMAYLEKILRLEDAVRRNMERVYNRKPIY